MPIDLKETRLPGVGVKYGLRLAAGGRLAIILHNDGKREVYVFAAGAEDAEPAAVITLDDDEARQLGAVIGGAYERPKIIDDLELALGESGFRARTRVTIVAILRDPEPVSGAQPQDVVKKGDTLVAVGRAGDFAAFRRLLAEGRME